MWNLFQLYEPEHRRRSLWLATLLIVLVAVLDWRTKPFLSLGFLYIFPILILAGVLRRWQLGLVALGCAALQERFSNLPSQEAASRMLFTAVGLAGMGLFLAELVRNRKLTLEHMREVEAETRLRLDAEAHLHMVIETSPAAILMLDMEGGILQANQGACQLFDEPVLAGRNVAEYLPTLASLAHRLARQAFRTSVQCRGRRAGGEAFLADVLCSSFVTVAGPRLAAIIVDFSEDLRGRSELGFDALLRNSRIIMGSFAHEIRNLCGAADLVVNNLGRIPEVESSRDFEGLRTLLGGLRRISSPGLDAGMGEYLTPIHLRSLADELEVLLAPALEENGVMAEWEGWDEAPLVTADRYGLIQVFLNLAKNSLRAMETATERWLRLRVTTSAGQVWIDVEDSGSGVAHPERLFRPFHEESAGSGLGLYVSRAILRSFSGDLHYAPLPQGSRFRVVLTTWAGGEEPS